VGVGFFHAPTVPARYNARMTLSLNYEAHTAAQTRGTRPGLVATIIALGIANLNFPFLWAWYFLEIPPYAMGLGAPGVGDVWAIAFLAGWPLLSIVLAIWGLFRCFGHPRKLAALLMGSFALTLDGIYILLLIRSLLP